MPKEKVTRPFRPLPLPDRRSASDQAQDTRVVLPDGRSIEAYRPLHPHLQE